MTNDNKICDNCGREIPDSAERTMSDIDTYLCDDCEGGEPEALEQVDQRLSDRDALGVEPREDNRLI